ncbi:MAG TPA: sialidase family protein [Polyangiaceae bacterium]
MRRLAVFGGVLLALATLPNAARANGRFPEAQRLLEHPSDPNRLYLTGTYGLLFTQDRGQNWFYVCESSFALAYLEGEPLLEVLPDGSLVGGIHESLNRTTDCGCTWTPKLAEPPLENVLDVALGSDARLVALVQDLTSLPARRLLYESSDHGETWSELSELPEELPNTFTVDVAPSDPNRLYVSATATSRPAGVLLVSEDRGRTWAERPIPGSSPSSSPYIAAVSPTDADVVYVRTDHWDTMTDFAAQDSLLVTTDGGGEFREILHGQAKLLGFALSPDGATVLAGYGDPIIAGRSTNFEDFGIYRASTTDFAFERITDEAVSCLRWTATGVYACLADVALAPSPDIALGFAPNADFTLAEQNPLAALLANEDVRGPLACTGAVCAETWTSGLEGSVSVCQALGAPCDGDFATNALDCRAEPGGGAGGNAGSGGAAGSGAGAGFGTGGAGASTAGSAPHGPDDADESDAGCGCRKAAGGSRGGALAALVLALAATRFFAARRARR